MASIHCSSVQSTSPGHSSSDICTICAMPFRMQILNETVYLGLNFLSWNSKCLYDPVTSCEFQIMICFDYVLQIYSLHPSLRVSNFQKFESATRAHGVHPHMSPTTSYWMPGREWFVPQRSCVLRSTSIPDLHFSTSHCYTTTHNQTAWLKGDGKWARKWGHKSPVTWERNILHESHSSHAIICDRKPLCWRVYV